ncbi:MAG: endonuclease [Coprobacillus sp.]|nr:endonuclease [Coprobacillus sp.]
MKKRLNKYILLLGVSVLLISGCNNQNKNEVSESSELDESVTPRDPVVPGVNGTAKTNYDPLEDVASYYVDIDMNKTGDSLEEELHDLISVMTKVSYGDCRYMLVYTDEAIGYPGYVYSSYDGDLIPAKWDSGETWNREHTWPRSRMGGEKTDNNLISRTSDLHNLRASCVTANDKRGNAYFGMVTSGDAFNPNITSGLKGEHRYVGDFRGDCARICFYMYVRYGRYDDECTLELNNNPSGSWTMGVLDTLLEWNIEDPVDEFETQRNNRIYEYQGNRNPFIDYPDLANNLFA